MSGSVSMYSALLSETNGRGCFLSDRAQQKRVFDTVKVANDTRGRSVTFPVLLPIPGSNRSSVIMTAKPFESGVPTAEDKTSLSQGGGTDVAG